jgi:hypothetical protein
LKNDFENDSVFATFGLMGVKRDKVKEVIKLLEADRWQIFEGIRQICRELASVAAQNQD